MKYLFLFFSFLFCAHIVHAASVEFVLPQAVNSEGIGTLRVFLNTEGVAVNMVAGSFVMPEGLVPREIETGSSAFALWVTEPSVTNQTISFAGAIPNGLSASRIPLLDVVFSAQEFSATEQPVHGALSAFLNTAEAEQIAVVVPSSVSWDFLVSSSSPLEVDRIAPEPFSVTVLAQSDMFLGKTVAIFSTVDKQSGMDYFEVQVHRSPVPDAAHWFRAESPVVVPDDIDTKFFSVKAVDRAGNIRVVTRAPLLWRHAVLLLLPLLFLIAVVVYVAKRRVQKN